MMLRWASSIFGLFALCGPTAVLWRVISIVVDTIKAVMRRWFPSHIGEKVFVFIPALIDGDAARSVKMVISDIGITTTAFHGRPGTIFGRFVPFAVRSQALASQLFFQASTRPRVATFQAVGVYAFLSSAVTAAKGFTTGLKDNGPASESLSHSKHGAILA